MSLTRRVLVLFPVLAVAALPAWSQETGFKHENNPENLKALFQEIHKTIFQSKDAKRAGALFRALIPDEPRLKKAVKDGVPAATVQAIQGLHKKQLAAPLTEAELVKLARPEQTAVQVHKAATEEIIKYAEGSVAFREFPGGARRVAEQILRPGMTFYEVEFLEPGKDAGVKYHLFYWDGKQWTMLGPVWRVLK